MTNILTTVKIKEVLQLCSCELSWGDSLSNRYSKPIPNMGICIGYIHHP